MDSIFAALRRRAFVADSDDVLLTRFVSQGDHEAFAELVQRHGRLVYAAARRRLTDADAADVYQATFLILVQKAPRLTDRITLGPWLYRVAALTARNVARRQERALTSLGDFDIPNTPPDPTNRWDLDEALLILPERDRSAVVMCHMLGYTRTEAAERLGLPEGTLSTVLHRALGRLRAKLCRDAVPLLTLIGVTVPAGLASATVRTSLAVSEGGLIAAAPKVAAVASGGLRSLAVPTWVKALLLASVGVSVGWGVASVGGSRDARKPVVASVRVVHPWVSVHVTAQEFEGSSITWREYDAAPDMATRRVVVELPVRSVEGLRSLLDRQRAELGQQPMQIRLHLESTVSNDRIVGLAKVFVDAGVPIVDYSGPLPTFIGVLGTETCDWTRVSFRPDPTPTHLPTAFGLQTGSGNVAATAEATALEMVGRFGGRVTRDDTQRGGPVVSVAISSYTITDADLSKLRSVPSIVHLDLQGCWQLTDDSAKTLLAFPNLQELDLRRTQLSAKAIQQIRDSRPKCRVSD